MSPFLMEVPAKGAPRSFSVERHTTYLVAANWLLLMLMSRELSAWIPRAFVKLYHACGSSLIAFSGTIRLPTRIWISKLPVGCRKMSTSESPEAAM